LFIERLQSKAVCLVAENGADKTSGLDNISEMTSWNCEKVLRVAEMRSAWRKNVHTAVNNWSEDNRRTEQGQDFLKILRLS